VSEKTTVTCDECGKTGDTRGIIGWLTVTKYNLAHDTSRLGEKPWDRLDLCSWRCLAAYGSERTT
jgi:hypothetical protein